MNESHRGLENDKRHEGNPKLGGHGHIVGEESEVRQRDVPAVM